MIPSSLVNEAGADCEVTDLAEFRTAHPDALIVRREVWQVEGRLTLDGSSPTAVAVGEVLVAFL